MDRRSAHIPKFRLGAYIDSMCNDVCFLVVSPQYTNYLFAGRKESFSMNVFDIIGPVMVGPSSSHTAGAVRIGRMTGNLLGEEPARAVIQLHGSFAKTYKGHGTDKAIIGGLLGMNPDDERIKESPELAKQAGKSFVFQTVSLKNAHPNTAVITATGVFGKTITVEGASVGGGNIVIRQINGMQVEFTGQQNTLIIFHQDAVGVIASATELLARNGINIANMRDFRSQRNGEAIMVIETDQAIPGELGRLIKFLPQIHNAIVIEPI